MPATIDAATRGDRRRQRQGEDTDELVHVAAEPDQAPMLPSTSASTLAFAAWTACFLENTRPRPASGFSTSSSGASGLKGPGPAALRRARRRWRCAATARLNGRTAHSSVAVQPSSWRSSHRRRAPGRRRSARPARARPSATPRPARREDEQRGAAAADGGEMAEVARRATWPSSRALSSLRGVAGRSCPGQSSRPCTGLFQRRPELEGDKGPHRSPFGRPRGPSRGVNPSRGVLRRRQEPGAQRGPRRSPEPSTPQGPP